MLTRYFALIFGIVYIAAGLQGFFVGNGSATTALPPDTVGRALGLFPINLWHNLVHLAIGIWGVLAYRSYDASRSYARGLAIIYGLLTIMGLLPFTNTTFGLIPIYGHDVWLHALTALVAAYFGFIAPAERDTTVETIDASRVR